LLFATNLPRLPLPLTVLAGEPANLGRSTVEIRYLAINLAFTALAFTSPRTSHFTKMGSTSEANELLKPASPRPGKPIRRVSSMSAQRENLFSGPTLVVPDHELDAPGNAHEMALALELAKYHLAEHSSGDNSPLASPPSTGQTTPELVPTTTDKYAFAFDIDGVLIRGGKVIPQAIEAMKVLNGQNDLGIKV